MKPLHQPHQTTYFSPLLMHTENCHHQSLNEGQCSRRAHPGVKHRHMQKQRTSQGLHAWVWGIQRLKPERPRQKMRIHLAWGKGSKLYHPHKKSCRWRRPIETCLEEGSTVLVSFFSASFHYMFRYTQMASTFNSSDWAAKVEPRIRKK